MKVLYVFGTRPEAIKLAPLILQTRQDPRFTMKVASTGQHREMLKPIFEFFGIKPDYDLDLMKPGQSLIDVSVGVMQGLREILQKEKKEKFDALIVQGDTTSCFIASLVGFYEKIPVVHVEAGLRSGDMHSPFPEEFNRRATSLIADLHLAPTEGAAQHLLRENIPASQIFVTGNTGIDALLEVKRKFAQDPSMARSLASRFSFLNPAKKLILVTVHRRESFGAPLEAVMRGLVELSKRPDIEILIPLHMNPEVRQSASRIFAEKARLARDASQGPSAIWLCEPQDYVPFVYLMSQAHLIITDSGGVQEEAPSFGKPILVAREKTERPEAIAAGTSKLVPLEADGFFKAVCEVLDNPDIYRQMAQARNPFGDGQACERILEILAQRYSP